MYADKRCVQSYMSIEIEVIDVLSLSKMLDFLSKSVQVLDCSKEQQSETPAVNTFLQSLQ